MNRAQQETFVNELIGEIRNELACKIIDGRIPEDWDGFELRQLIADRFKEVSAKMHPARLKRYRNTVIVKNL